MRGYNLEDWRFSGMTLEFTRLNNGKVEETITYEGVERMSKSKVSSYKNIKLATDLLEMVRKKYGR